ncbi:hypothetical protein [Flagellimonas nanhaiensis]|uniref:Secreted protein n=1 Tax=Flagellimonas nanhaiensis TaxID=2292706 RepID=A0A371JV59_9FLAO|nr:hypothetical protein [Allomuricauda nanhaiensis]RDY61666.1 hypothetical protein DX873_05800 [Allomuricauda nanhaiensis]
MRKFIGLLLFTSLMVIKVSSFHVYAHQDGDSETIENCNICDLALENQTLDFQTSDNSYVLDDTEFSIKYQKTLKDEQLKEQSFDYYLSSRPPPTPVV